MKLMPFIYFSVYLFIWFHICIRPTPFFLQPVLFSQYPPPRDYIPEKPIRSMHKKQNEVWRFLSDTRHGLHDVGWLSHCRKAVCSVLKSGEEIKVACITTLIMPFLRFPFSFITFVIYYKKIFKVWHKWTISYIFKENFFVEKLI